jgi:hypothetical protein
MTTNAEMAKTETPLQHHVEIGADPHAAADVVASLIRSDQRSGTDLPAGLPPHVVYHEPTGADRIPAPATVVHEGAAACGAMCRAQASKEKATHVGVCRATGKDGKPVHHAFLVAAARPGEKPLVTDPHGKAIGGLDMRRKRDPSSERGMACGCHVPDHLYQEASFAAIHPDRLHPDHPGGAAHAHVHAHPAERAAAGVAYQGAPRAHLPESPGGRAVAQVAALAARAVTPPPGHEPRLPHELYPHPEVHHPEADAPHVPHHPHHLGMMVAELSGALHTIGSGVNPHPLPEDPPLTPAHVEAAKSMAGTLMKVSMATPAHEHHPDDPVRQAEVLALVPQDKQHALRGQILSAASMLEHVDGKQPENDVALSVASELTALLPGVLPPEVGHALRRRRATRQTARMARLAADLIQVGSEPDASLAMSLALMVALDDVHVGCPWDGRRPPPPDHHVRPVRTVPAPPPAADAPVGGLARHRRDIGEAGQTASTLASEFGAGTRSGWLAELQSENGGRPATESTALGVGSSWLIPKAWWPESWKDPAVAGHGGGGHVGGHGLGGHGGLGWLGGGLGWLDCGPVVYDPSVTALPDFMLGDVGRALAAIFTGGLSEVANAAQSHPQAATWKRTWGERFWEHPEWQRRFWHRDKNCLVHDERALHADERAGNWRGAAHREAEIRHDERRLHHDRFLRGVSNGPDLPVGWFGPQVDEQGRPLVIGQSMKGGGAYTWGGARNGWVPSVTWARGHLADGWFVPGPVRDILVGGGFMDKDESLACDLVKDAAALQDVRVSGWFGWDWRGRDRVVHNHRHAAALRRYWRDAEFRRAIDLGYVVDGWDLAALSEVMDPPLGGWWGRLWGRERVEPHHWWRRDRSWDRGWDWWSARLPHGHAHTEWLRRFHADADFRRRAEAGEIIEGIALADALAWANQMVPGSVPDVVIGAWPGLAKPYGYGGGYKQSYGYGGYKPSIYNYQTPAPPVVVTPPPAPTVDQYGNTLDQYGNLVVGPNGGPIMGPYGPMNPGQVPLHGVPPLDLALNGIPEALMDVPTECGLGGMAEDIRQGVRAVTKGKPCRRCAGAG